MSKVKLNYAIVCEQVIVDSRSNVSIVNAFDQIKAKGIPTLHSKFSVIVNTYGEAGKYDETIEIVNLSTNETIVSVADKIEIKPNGANSFVGNFVNTVFPSFGKYWIKVTADGEVLTNQDIHHVFLVKD